MVQVQWYSAVKVVFSSSSMMQVNGNIGKA